MSELIMIVGFALATYSIVANDSIQTLGTFLSSNSKRPWWVLWMWISGILVVTVSWGWYANCEYVPQETAETAVVANEDSAETKSDDADSETSTSETTSSETNATDVDNQNTKLLGDPAFGRLGKVAFPKQFNWLYLVPPLILVLLTQSGIPVSTTFLVLTSFSSMTAYQLGGSPSVARELLMKMATKSFVGYGLAFVVGLLVFGLIITFMERRVLAQKEGKDSKYSEDQLELFDDLHPRTDPKWLVMQWLSTGFLWSVWLVQDLANVFVYLPRKVSAIELGMALVGMVILQGILFGSGGGKIQKVVTTKTNTLDIRSATMIDLTYGLVLLFFKVDYIPKLFMWLGLEMPWPQKLPMSTTWVFLGLLAGREIGLVLRLRHRKQKKVANLVFRDAGKAFLGMVISIVVAFGLPPLAYAIYGSLAK